MRQYVLTLISVMLIIEIGAAFWVMRGLSDFDLSEHSVRDVSFQLGDTVLSGTLIMPRDVSSPPIAVIVHGDGAQDRFSNGGYFPLVNTLVDAPHVDEVLEHVVTMPGAPRVDQKEFGGPFAAPR